MLASTLQGPSVDWVSLSPLLVLLGAAMVLLVVDSLTPPWPKRLYALVTAGTGLATGILTIVLWHQVDREGPVRLVGDAMVLDKVALWVTLVISVAVVLVSLVTDDYLRREGIDGPEVYALYLMAGIGGIVMGSANDLIVLFLGLEILSIALYVLAAFNRKLNFTVIREVCVETGKTSAFIFAIFIGATVFAFVLRSLGGDELISGVFKGLGLGPNGLIMVVLAVVFVAGFFLDWFEIVLIVLPLLAPVIKDLGIDMTWFLVIVAVMLQSSFLTPPVGFSLFYLKGAAPKSVTIKDIYIGVLPFVALQMLMVVACFIWPEIITWLPKQMYGAAAP